MNEVNSADSQRVSETTHREALQAVAWDDALQYAYDEGYFTRPQLEALQESNPYRTTR